MNSTERNRPLGKSRNVRIVCYLISHQFRVSLVMHRLAETAKHASLSKSEIQTNAVSLVQKTDLSSPWLLTSSPIRCSTSLDLLIASLGFSCLGFHTDSSIKSIPPENMVTLSHRLHVLFGQGLWYIQRDELPGGNPDSQRKN